MRLIRVNLVPLFALFIMATSLLLIIPQSPMSGVSSSQTGQDILPIPNKLSNPNPFLPPQTANPPEKVWKEIGPAPISDPSQSNVSGAVEDIAVDPGNLSHWFIATYGGVWETRNAGLTWSPKTDDQASLVIGAVSIAPSNSSIVYAGTGTQFPVPYMGSGLLKSMDGGTTWHSLLGTTFEGASFVGLAVNPQNADMLVAGTLPGTDGFYSYYRHPPVAGLYMSTNGGVNWTLTLQGNPSDIEVDPTNFDRQYAGLGHIIAPSQNPNGLYRSLDGGATWSQISGPWTGLSVGPVETAIAPSDPNTLYVSIVKTGLSFQGRGGRLLGMWRTNNAWATTPSWTLIPNPDSSDWSYTNKLFVDSTNSSIVFAGGIDLFKFDGIGWVDITGNLHSDFHAMAWAGSRLIVGNDGGVYSTTDRGATWHDHNTNLSTILFYQASPHLTNPNFVLAGTQDNGSEKWNGTSWSRIGGGDGGYSAISSRRPDTDWAISSQYLSIIRTTNGGLTFTRADSGIDHSLAPFIGVFTKCPTNDDIFIAGTTYLWKSPNFFSSAVPSWSPNSPDTGYAITAIAFAPSDPTCNTYSFATQNGQLYLTTNGGATWANVDPENQVPNRFATDLAFDSKSANVLYVTLSGFNGSITFDNTISGPGHLFETRNSLASSPTWYDLSPPVDLSHNAILLDSSNPTSIFVGTNVGIWTSSDCGSTWTHEGPETGMPNVPVLDLEKRSDGTVMAFTFGRGAFTRKAYQGSMTPCAPGNLQASRGDHRVSLSWEVPPSVGSSPITGYRIYRGTSPSGETLLTSIGNTTVFSDSGLENGLEYYYEVSAASSVAEGAKSREVSATPATIPLVPRNLQTIAGNGRASLSWDAPSSNGGTPVTRYRIYRGTVSGNLSVHTTLGAEFAYTDIGLVNGVTYYYQVSALNAVGESSRSDEATALPRATSSPGKPRAIQANGGYASIVLTWQAPASEGSSPVTGYRIYRSSMVGGPTAVLTTVGTVLTYSDTNVTSGVTYFYRLSAVSAVGEGPLSDEGSAALAVDTVKPLVSITAPSSGSTLTSITVTVSGTASDNVQVEKVEVSTDGTTWVLATGTTSWSVVLNLNEGQNTIYVRATDTSGNTGQSSIIVTTTTTTTSPATPSVFRVISQNLRGILVGFAIVALLVTILVALVVRNERRRQDRMAIRIPNLGRWQ